MEGAIVRVSAKKKNVLPTSYFRSYTKLPKAIQITISMWKLQLPSSNSSEGHLGTVFKVCLECTKSKYVLTSFQGIMVERAKVLKLKMLHDTFLFFIFIVVCFKSF